MKGGNEATIGSGITQFAEGEPKKISREVRKVRKVLKNRREAFN